MLPPPGLSWWSRCPTHQGCEPGGKSQTETGTSDRAGAGDIKAGKILKQPFPQFGRYARTSVHDLDPQGGSFGQRPQAQFYAAFVGEFGRRCRAD